MEKLASVQVKSDELNLYSSVRNIGQKEKRKFDNLEDGTLIESNNQTDSGESKKYSVNSISGSNKKRRNGSDGKEDDEESDSDSIDTDDMSTDSEVDEESIKKALEQSKLNEQAAISKTDTKKEVPAARIDSDEENEQLKNPNKTSNRAIKYVHVDRREEIKESRSKLPIITEEQVIMEKISENDIVIISGETGSGKTTQLPQFLYEAGYAE